MANHRFSLVCVLLVIALAVGPAAAQTPTPGGAYNPTPEPRPTPQPILTLEASAFIWPRRVVYLSSPPDGSGRVIVEAGASRDPGGSSLEYAFDTDGDGVDDRPFFFNSAGGGDITMPGPFVVTARVRNASGATDQISFPMEARQFQHGHVHGWGAPSLAVIGNRPAYAMMDADGLYFAINSLPDGRGPWTTNRVTPIDFSMQTGEVGRYPCPLAQLSGRPVIACAVRKAGSWELIFARNQRSDGSGPWSGAGLNGPLKVISVSEYPAPTLGSIAGRPAIAYFNNGTVTLLIEGAPAGAAQPVMVSDAFALLWSFTVGNAPPASHSAIVQVGQPANLPAIAFLDAAKGQLTYAVNQRSDGTGRWDLIAVEAQRGDIGIPSLVMTRQGPAIAYRDGATGHLKVAVAATADGRGAWQVTPVDRTTRPGGPAVQSLAVIDGRLAVAYEHETQGLLFAYHPGFESGYGWATAVVDPRPVPFSSGIYAMAPSLALVDGRPGIVYNSVGGIQYATAR